MDILKEYLKITYGYQAPNQKIVMGNRSIVRIDLRAVKIEGIFLLIFFPIPVICCSFLFSFKHSATGNEDEIDR